MLELSIGQIDQLNRMKRIQSCYIQSTEPINKALSADKLIELSEGEMKGKIFTKERVLEVCDQLSKAAVVEDLEKGEKEIEKLERIKVVSGNKVVEMYAECRDIEKGEYSDNALNKLLDRVGKKYKAVEEVA